MTLKEIILNYIENENVRVFYENFKTLNPDEVVTSLTEKTLDAFGISYEQDDGDGIISLGNTFFLVSIMPCFH